MGAVIASEYVYIPTVSIPVNFVINVKIPH
jgi:hypothetical protein